MKVRFSKSIWSSYYEQKKIPFNDFRLSQMAWYRLNTVIWFFLYKSSIRSKLNFLTFFSTLLFQIHERSSPTNECSDYAIGPRYNPAGLNVSVMLIAFEFIFSNHAHDWRRNDTRHFESSRQFLLDSFHWTVSIRLSDASSQRSTLDTIQSIVTIRFRIKWIVSVWCPSFSRNALSSRWHLIASWCSNVKSKTILTFNQIISSHSLQMSFQLGRSESLLEFLNLSSPNSDWRFHGSERTG